MLDADREADRRVGDADAVAHLLRDAGMRRRGRVRGKRFGAAEADRELEDAQRVEEAEGLGLAALDVEREGRAGGVASRREHPPGRAAMRQEGRKIDLGDAPVEREVARRDLGVAAGGGYGAGQRLA